MTLEIKATEKDSYVLIEILKNGTFPSPQNLVLDEDYFGIDYPEIHAKLAIISGFPQDAACTVQAQYHGTIAAIAIANPKTGMARITKSVNPAHPVGSLIPLQ